MVGRIKSVSYKTLKAIQFLCVDCSLHLLFFSWKWWGIWPWTWCSRLSPVRPGPKWGWVAVFTSGAVVENKAASPSGCGASGQCVCAHRVNKRVYLWKANKRSLNTQVHSALCSNLSSESKDAKCVFCLADSLSPSWKSALLKCPPLCASVAPWASLLVALTICVPVDCPCPR